MAALGWLLNLGFAGGTSTTEVANLELDIATETDLSVAVATETDLSVAVATETNLTLAVTGDPEG